MLLGGQVRAHEGLEAHADPHRSAELWKEAVVEARSAPEPHAVGAEGHARDDDHLDGGRIDGVTDRLADAPVPRCERRAGVVRDHDQLVPLDARQQDASTRGPT